MDSLSFLENKKIADTVAVLGIPLDLGKDNEGTEDAPKVLRTQGLISALESIGLKVEDHSDLTCPKRREVYEGDRAVKYIEPIVSVAEEAARRVAQEVRAGKKCIALGGDHSLSIGTISGAAKALPDDMGVIWIDAHGDINTHETTLSGNIHGMPLAAVLGMGHESLVNVLEPGRKVKPENVLYIGLKDLDQAEIDIIRKNNIAAVTTGDIAESGLSETFKKIAALSQKVKRVWVSLDIDAIDEHYAPATPMINRGGLTYREITWITKYIGRMCNLSGMDVVEFAPNRDEKNKTAKLIIELIANLLGSEYNWYTAYMEEEERKKENRMEAETAIV